MNKVNPFRALVAPLPLISLSNLSTIDDVVLVPSLSKTLLAKETVRSIRTLLSKLPITLLYVLPRNPTE